VTLSLVHCSPPTPDALKSARRRDFSPSHKGWPQRPLGYRGPISGWLLVALLSMVVTTKVAAQITNSPAGGAERSVLLEVAGRVERMNAGGTNWQTAIVGADLGPGDRVRTRGKSRAAVQLSDRSVIRLDEQTTLEILPPRHEEKHRFSLPKGALYFFNREKPADVEFDTPLAAGAIRGTEFLLEVAASTSELRLALIDGLVSLQTGTGEISLQGGEDLHIRGGEAPQKTALVNANNAIQWALYYPAVLEPGELHLSTEDTDALAEVLAKYNSGDLLAALAAWPAELQADSDGGRLLYASLELAVGQVAAAEHVLAELPQAATTTALRELIQTVKGETNANNSLPATASEWLARSYALQARADLPGALAAAQAAVNLGPECGFAHARLAELEFAFGDHHAALSEATKALSLAPRYAPAQALRGFILLDRGDVGDAKAAFDAARQMDAAFGPAWLGRGLCLLRERRFAEARAAFQAAAALEPQRALFRSYLGKTASELGDNRAADKEFGLAKRLDPNDPTGWLYSALHLWQQNRINEAIRDLEHGADLNDSRALFRSRFLLDEDRSVASANLAALYDDAGLSEVSRHAAARAVAEDYANFSGHLFLANSYQTLEQVDRFDLRLETARQSELLVANLLAPPGAGNLSQQLSQQQHLQFFDPRPFGISSMTEYTSRGDWTQVSTLFGTVGGLGYAIDSQYESLNGQRPNNDSESRRFEVTLKQRVGADDEFYFQAGDSTSDAGDVANRYDPAAAVEGFRVHETQEPSLYAGWHHTWSPGSHTLMLISRLTDHLSYTNPQPNVVFLIQNAGAITGIQSPPAGPSYGLDFASDFTLYSGELQQIWETPHQSLIVGGRWQSGEIGVHSALNRQVPGGLTDQTISGSMDRDNLYAYYSWQALDSLRFTAGVSYDHLSFPANTDLPPLSSGKLSRDLISPKAGLLLTPWNRGLVRASYSQSMGGVFFDNSVRLEPTQIGGFNQAFRSLIPESVAGLVPGSSFETAGAAFDQSFAGGTWVGVEAEWLTSHGQRGVGAFTNNFFFPEPDSPTSTREDLGFRERDLSVYGAQLLGDQFSVGARYRLSEAHLNEEFPQIPTDATGLDLLRQHNRATLQEVSLAATFNHPSGFFAQWQSSWYQQSNSGYDTSLSGSEFWQHDLYAGYRFPRRYAEIRLGILNIAGADYRLNPLNPYAELPRARVFTASLRLNF